MRRKLALACLMLIAAGILSGCDGKKNPDKEVTPTPAPTVTEHPDDERNTPTPDAPADVKEITLPEDSLKVADYSTTKGLKIPAGMHIAVVVNKRTSDYWKAVEQGAQQAINDLNEQMDFKKDDKIKMTFEGPDSEDDVETQINTIDAVLAENPSALCLGVIDQNSCEAQLENARENGIPVLTVDSGLKDQIGLKSCATDNYEAGREAARRLCASIGDDGKVAVASHIESTQSSKERIRGFREELEENHPQVALVKVNYENNEKAMRDMVLETLELYPDLKGIFSTNDEMTRETLEALEGLENAPKLVGMDTCKEIRGAIEDERMVGTISQNPYGMGYAMIVLAVRESLGLPNQMFVDSGFQWIDKHNLSAQENLKYFY